MAWRDGIKAFDAAIDVGMVWISNHGNDAFALLRGLLEGGFGAILWLLAEIPFWALSVMVGALGWRLLGWRFGAFATASLALCAALGLWTETIETLALVLSATTMAVLIGGGIGVFAGLSPRLARLLDPVLDLIQTLPPYLYLLPAIAFLGYGPATAILATFIVAVPPTVKLTALGISRTPTEFLELGAASGASGWQVFSKIRLPFALASIMAGVNQSLMMAFGMVVIAGIVGSGGLGQTIYASVRTLDIARSVDAAIAIVVLTIVLDRLSQTAARPQSFKTEPRA
ncbi:glycine betaine/proline transport system permease protein [Rhodobacter viridis]|uniref:Glycine betaine/proline transport system permease protein n=1 Tax=Rhodobacter viridis TaxID=1054202 RepID=A0A318TXZ2_9RHOB|nr:ABC transporter permease subunit [Rhodobacter viridis]PYF06925.1 glycine betaine/proline transport system permease protein [Rhodobacter viridis]